MVAVSAAVVAAAAAVVEVACDGASNDVQKQVSLVPIVRKYVQVLFPTACRRCCRHRRRLDAVRASCTASKS